MGAGGNLYLVLSISGFACFAFGIVYFLGSLYRDKIAASLRTNQIIVKRQTEGALASDDIRAKTARMIRRLGLENLFNVQVIRKRLIQSGERGPDAVDKVIFAKLMMPPVGILISYQYDLATFFFDQFDDRITVARILIAALFAAVTFYIPDFMLLGEIQKRQEAIRRSFSEATDLLYICVQAGMSFEQAANRVTREIGEFSAEIQDEFTLLTAELSYLSNRRQALQNLRERINLVEVDNFVLVIQQADRYGTALGDALRVISSDARTARMTALEKKALALPPKLAVPITFFILPGIVAMVFAPMYLGGFALPG